MYCRWVGVDSECTQVRPPLLVQVATYKRVYVFVAKDRTGVSNPHLAKLFANGSVVKAFFGADEHKTLSSIGPLCSAVNLQTYGPPIGLQRRKLQYGLGDFASALSGTLLKKDECGRFFGEIGALAQRNRPTAAEKVEHRLAALPERYLLYSATDAWVTKAAYEHLLRTGLLRDQTDSSKTRSGQ
eukprot:EG_transcript_31400